MALRSLRALTAAFLLVFLVATIGTAVGIYVATLNTIDHVVGQRIVSASMAIVPEDEAVDALEISRRIRDASRDRDTGDLGFLLQRDGTPVAGNVVLRHPLRDGFSRLGVEDGIKGLSRGRALTRDLGNGLRLTVIGETEPFDHYNFARLRIYLLGFGSIIVIALAAATVFGMTIRRRMLEMRRTVDAIIEGDLSRRVPVDGSHSEFDIQAEAFNRMIARICELMEEIRTVSSGVAHELRTPLARLRNELNLLAGDPAAAAVRDRLLFAQGQADQLLAMFAALLRIAEIESGDRRAAFAPVDLSEIVGQCVEALEPAAEERGQALVPARMDTAIVNGDPRLLAQLVINLLENAIRHPPPQTKIAIAVKAEATRVLLSVVDNGPGIPVDERERALRRFTRLPGAGGSGGYGIGLSLAHSIARLHGGELELGDALPGLAVTVSIPRA